MSTPTRVAPQPQAPPAPAPQTPTVLPVARPARRGVLARAFEGTPGRLRAVALAAVVVCMLFALLGANAFRARGEALDAARAGADQVVRVQQIATDLVQADAAITNAFLQGAKERPGAYAEYQARIAAASQGIAEASRAEQGDAAVLAQVNDSLTRYTGAVETARANNRFGYQVGSGYLRQASDLLRKPSSSFAAILPTLQSVADTDAARVDDAFTAARRAVLYLVAAGVVVLGGLLAVQFWLARRTRRILNIPLTAGTVTVLAALVVGGATMFLTQSRADTVRDTSYAATRSLSQARISAFDARANESLALVYQGSGQANYTAFDKQFGLAKAETAKALRAGASNLNEGNLDAWNGVHTQIKTLDQQGNWQKAVDLATGIGPGTASDAFTPFAQSTGSALKAQAGQVASGIDASHTLLVGLGWLTLVLGLVAAVLAWRGVGQRLEEYR